jgi:hypothetical protein
MKNSYTENEETLKILEKEKIQNDSIRFLLIVVFE